MQIVVGGASGFLGSALVSHLKQQGHHVTRLVRSGEPASDASLWDPSAGRVDQVVIDRADAVVNLSGAPISQWPRTPKRRKEIRHSRLCATTTLARAVAASSTPTAFICGSGMSWFGVDRGDQVLTEAAGPGEGFLAEVSQQWEAAAAPATEAGARVCFLRTSIVLDSAGGALSLMLRVWKLGGGAKLGTGRQFMSVISRHDWVRATTFLLENDEAHGAFNLATPSAQTNADYTEALGEAVHRPTFLKVPSFALKAALGGLADDLLGSLRLYPAALLDAGFTFDQPDLASTLERALQ